MRFRPLHLAPQRWIKLHSDSAPIRLAAYADVLPRRADESTTRARPAPNAINPRRLRRHTSWVAVLVAHWGSLGLFTRQTITMFLPDTVASAFCRWPVSIKTPRLSNA